MTKVSDQDLIRVFSQGDEEAGNELVRRYYLKVLSLCRYLLYTHDESWDAAQDIFLNIIGRRKILKYRGEAKLWTWLYRVTMNTCYDRLRQQRGQKLRMAPFVEQAGPEELLPAHELDPEEANIRHEELERLIKMVYHLEDKYRDPVVLVCLRGYTYAEAAQELRITRQTLGVRLLRAKRKLCGLLVRTRSGCHELPGACEPYTSPVLLAQNA